MALFGNYGVAVAVLVVGLGLCIWTIGKLRGTDDHERNDDVVRGADSGNSSGNNVK